MIAAASVCYAAVYPRVCGGTATAVSIASTARGLSPRVRGNLVFDPPAASPLGSIPACAGEPKV